MLFSKGVPAFLPALQGPHTHVSSAVVTLESKRGALIGVHGEDRDQGANLNCERAKQLNTSSDTSQNNTLACECPPSIGAAEVELA